MLALQCQSALAAQGQAQPDTMDQRLLLYIMSSTISNQKAD